MTTTFSDALRIDTATEADRPVLERLWTMFQHDLSAHSGALPDADGRFRQDRLDAALTDPDWRGYLMRRGELPVGFAIIRSLHAAERVINSFFLVHGVRRAGHGAAVARTIVEQHPGAWAVAYHPTNHAAQSFWTSVASAADADWRRERRPVPGRPELTPDPWILFTVSPR